MSGPAPARVDAAAPFLVARSVVLYGLSLHAVASARLAWPMAAGSDGLWLAGAALGLAVAQMAGEWLSPGMASLLHPLARSRLRITVAAAYPGVVALALMAALAAADPQLVAQETAFFAILQGLSVLLYEVLGGPLAAMANALVLVVLAGLHGGTAAAVAVTAYLGLLVFFLTLDHFAQRLAGQAADGVGLLGFAVRQAARLAVPAMIALTAFFAGFPARPYAPLVLDAGSPQPLPAEVSEAYRHLLLLAIAGGGVVFLIARVLRRRQDPAPPTLEQVAPEARVEEVLPRRERPGRTSYPGSRGRIVHAYVRLLERAGERGFRRRPHQTPLAIATEVRAPAAQVAELTGLFVRARYGPDEPTEADARAAEAAVEAIASAWRRGPVGPRPRTRRYDAKP